MCYKPEYITSVLGKYTYYFSGLIYHSRLITNVHTDFVDGGVG